MKELTESKAFKIYCAIWIDYEVGNITKNQRDLQLKDIKKYIDMYHFDNENYGVEVDDNGK